MKKEKKIYITDSAAQTKKMGFLLARAVLESGLGKQARVLALRGDLGAGKTQFVQGFAKGLGVEGTVNSPTFVIFRKYPLRLPFENFYHFDCYRLVGEDDLARLGSAAIFADQKNIVAIEWPVIAQNMFKMEVLDLYFEVIEENKRRITIS